MLFGMTDIFLLNFPSSGSKDMTIISFEIVENNWDSFGHFHTQITMYYRKPLEIPKYMAMVTNVTISGVKPDCKRSTS